MAHYLLSEQLKQYTLSNHQQLEKSLITQMRSINTHEEYVKFLQFFYSYFGALEDKINQYIGAAQLVDHLQRRKTESLLNDIKTIRGIIPEKAKDADLPKIENHLQAFGALYVIEGSTLGGKIISKMMAKQLNIENNKGLSFFSGYGEETERMWASFKELLNRQPQNEADAELIINAANDTFAKFKLWIEKNS